MRRIKLARLPALEQEDVTARLNAALDDERKQNEQISAELAQQQEQGSQTQPVITEQQVVVPQADGAGNATSPVPPSDPALDPNNQSAQAADPIGTGDPAPATVPPVAQTVPGGDPDPISGQAQAVGDAPNTDTAGAVDAAEAAAAQAAAELAQANETQAAANVNTAPGEIAEAVAAPLTVEEVNTLVNSGKSPEEIVEILKTRTVEATPAVSDPAANGATGDLTPQTTLTEAGSATTDATGAADAGNAIPDANGVQAAAGAGTPDQVLDQAGNVDPTASDAPTAQAAETTPAPSADPATTTDPQGEVNGATAKDPGQEIAATSGAADGASASAAGAVDADADPGTQDAAAGAIDATQTTETAPVVDATGEQVATATVTKEPDGATQDAGAPTGETNGDPTTVTGTTPQAPEGLTTGEAKEVAEGAQTIEQSEADEAANATAANADANAEAAAAAAGVADAAADAATATAAQTGAPEDAAAAAQADTAAAAADESANAAAADAAQADAMATGEAATEPAASEDTPATDPTQTEAGTTTDSLGADADPAAPATDETNLNGDPAPAEDPTATGENGEAEEVVDPDANLNEEIEKIDETEEEQTEIEDMVEEAYGVSDRLGKIAEIVEDVMQEDENGMSEGLAKIVSIATESLYEQVGITPNYQLMALESFDTENARNLASAIALEDIKENVQRVASAIVKGIQHLIQLITETIKRLIGGVALIKRDIKNLREAAKAAKESGNAPKATAFEAERLAQSLRLRSGVDANPEKQLLAVQRVAVSVFGEVRDWSTESAKLIDDAFGNYMFSANRTRMDFTMPAIKPMQFSAFREDKQNYPSLNEDERIVVSEELPGSKVVQITGPVATDPSSTVYTRLMLQILGQKRMGGKLIDSVHNDDVVDKELTTMTPDQVIAFCDEGEKLVKALEMNKKVMDENVSYLRGLKLVKTVGQLSSSFSLEGEIFRAYWGVAQLFAEPSTSFAKYIVRILRDYISYSKQSLAQYQTSVQTSGERGNGQLAAA